MSSENLSEDPFDVNSCLTDGCNRIAKETQNCDRLEDGVNPKAARLGCEIGRDFRFAGFTSLLKGEAEFFQCRVTSGKVNPLRCSGFLNSHLCRSSRSGLNCVRGS